MIVETGKQHIYELPFGGSKLVKDKYILKQSIMCNPVPV